MMTKGRADSDLHLETPPNLHLLHPHLLAGVPLRNWQAIQADFLVSTYRGDFERRDDQGITTGGRDQGPAPTGFG